MPFVRHADALREGAGSDNKRHRRRDERLAIPYLSSAVIATQNGAAPVSAAAT